MSQGVASNFQDLEFAHIREPKRKVFETILHHRQDTQRAQVSYFFRQIVDFVSANIQDFQERQFVHLVWDINIDQSCRGTVGDLLLWGIPESCLPEY